MLNGFQECRGKSTWKFHIILYYCIVYTYYYILYIIMICNTILLYSIKVLFLEQPLMNDGDDVETDWAQRLKRQKCSNDGYSLSQPLTTDQALSHNTTSTPCTWWWWRWGGWWSSYHGAGMMIVFIHDVFCICIYICIFSFYASWW